MIIATAAIGFPADIIEIVRTNRSRWCSPPLCWLVVGHQGYDLGIRHINWVKIPIMLDALLVSDDVLWIDADALIVTEPNWSDLHGSMAVAKDANGWNIGVWYVHKSARWALECMWEQVQYVGRPMEEQAVFHDLDKWGLLHDVTQLGEEWNTQRDDAPLTYIRHYAGQYDTRFDSMRRLAKEVVLC